MQSSDCWYDADLTPLERADLCVSEAERIAQETAVRQARIEESYQLYGTDAIRDVPIEDRLGFNIIASSTDTLVSEVTQVETQPIVVAIGANYRQQRKAERLTAHIEQRFDDLEVPRKARNAARDAVLGGMGFLRAYDDGDQPAVERLHPLSVLVDDAACIDEEPRELYIRRAPTRKHLQALWPDRAEDIENAKSPGTSAWYSLTSTGRADRVQVWEAWHLPSRSGADDGRHIVAIDGCAPLVDEPWSGERFPVVPIRCVDAAMGWWGESLAQRIAGTQVERNKLTRRVQDSMDVHAVVRTFIPEGSTVHAHLTNDVDGIISYSGNQPPTFAPTPSMSSDVYARIGELKAEGFEGMGISQLAASSLKPAGLNSGVALRAFREYASRRYLAFERELERALCNLAEDLIAVERAIAERKRDEDKTHYVAYRWAGKVTKQAWSELDLPQDMVRVVTMPANALRRSTAGRLQDVQELVSAGLIDQRAALRLLNHPDFDQLRAELTGPEDLIRDVIGRILDGEGYISPDETMDYAVALRVAVQLLTQAELAGADQDELDEVRRWVADLKALQQRMRVREMQMAEQTREKTAGERMIEAQMAMRGPSPLPMGGPPQGMPPGPPPMPPGPPPMMPPQGGAV